MTSDNWTRENLAWAAGIIEGEGCIFVGSDKPQIKVVMCDKDVIYSLLDVIQLGTTRRKGRPGGNPNYKIQYEWQSSAIKDVYAILAAIYPWLHSRRSEAALEVIDYCKTKLISRRGDNNRKLNEEKVRTIRKRLMDGATIASLARLFSVSESTIRHVRDRRVWKHVT